MLTNKDSLESRLRLLTTEQRNVYKMITSFDTETVALGLTYLYVLLKARPGQEICKHMYYSIRESSISAKERLAFYEYLQNSFGKHVINIFMLSYTKDKLARDERNMQY
jgi:hypothetical protein